MDDLIVINRPIREEFEFTTNQATAKLWKLFVTESRQITNGEIGVGTQFIEGIDVFNRHLSGIVEILEYQPYHWFAIGLVKSQIHFRFSLKCRLKKLQQALLFVGM